jgi:hypothetical protein
MSHFIKHILKGLKAQIDSSTEVMGDYKTLLTPIDRSSKKQKSTKIS